MSEKFKPGLYRHFKGGHYYALGVAYSHEADPDNLTGGEVIYYSYEKQHWRRRPLTSPEELPDAERVGFCDKVNRPGFAGVPRFRLVQEVLPALAMRNLKGTPWIPVRPSEMIRLVDLYPSLKEMVLLPDPLRQRCRELNNKKMTASSARAKLYDVAPPGSEICVAEGYHLFVLELPPDAMGRRHSFMLLRFEREPDFPPAPMW